jgi:large subunit ribosomal protein L46
MSTSRSAVRLGADVASSSRRYLASQAGANSASSTSQPTVYASLLLSRPPLLTPTPTELESTYYNFTSSIQHAISNPPAQTNAFYFKAGSLPLRRFQQSQYESLKSTYGEKLAGPKPDIGDVPAENPVEFVSRDHWEKEDAKRGEKSLERFPEEEVYCVVKGKGDKWEVPRVKVEVGESLDDAVGRIREVGGMMEGQTMDSWLVTRKPIGSLKSDKEIVSLNNLHISRETKIDRQTFFLRSHIMAGEPKLSSKAAFTSWAWLTPKEIEEKLKAQGDEKVWEGIKAMFGVVEEEA